MMRVGFGLPQYNEHVASAETVARLASRAEEAGFDSLWTSENVHNAMMSPLSVLAFAAAVTRDIVLGLGVILLPLRVPVQIAREVSTLDVLSNGRLVLGVGFGRKHEALYQEYGLPTSDRLSRYLSALSLVRTLVAEGSATYDGPEWVLSGHSQIPQPVQRPIPPIWIAARAEAAIRRAVALADGWMMSGKADDAEIRRAIEIVSSELAARERDLDSFAVGKRMYLLTDPSAADHEMVRAWYGKIHGDPSLADSAVLMGDADTVVERLTELHRLGITDLVLNPVFDFEKQLERLVEDVLPRLRGL